MTNRNRAESFCGQGRVEDLEQEFIEAESRGRADVQAQLDERGAFVEPTPAKPVNACSSCGGTGEKQGNTRLKGSPYVPQKCAACDGTGTAKPAEQAYDIQELAAQVRAAVRESIAEAEAIGQRLDEQSRQRAEAKSRPVEQAVCSRCDGAGIIHMRVSDVDWERFDCPECRALGRPARPRP